MFYLTHLNIVDNNIKMELNLRIPTMKSTSTFNEEMTFLFYYNEKRNMNKLIKCIKCLYSRDTHVYYLALFVKSISPRRQ